MKLHKQKNKNEITHVEKYNMKNPHAKNTERKIHSRKKIRRNSTCGKHNTKIQHTEKYNPATQRILFVFFYNTQKRQ